MLQPQFGLLLASSSGPDDPAALIDAVQKVCDGVGPHAAVIAAAGAAAYEQALEYLRPSGTLVAVGLPPDSFIKTNVFWTVLRNIRIVGSYFGNRQDATEALDFAARGDVAPEGRKGSRPPQARVVYSAPLSFPALSND
ncbi:hypothetical protein JCM5296_001261 [Sporobolomyces johnsonii]